MDPAHIHLLITHLPVFGCFLGAVVLSYGLFTKSQETQSAAYLVLLISAIGALIAYFTGESAEEVVENIQGTLHDRIEEHEDAAIFALVSLCLTGLVSLFGWYSNFIKLTKATLVAKTTLLICLFSLTVVIRVAYLGGQIRHTEIYPTNGMNPPVELHEKHE